MTYEFNIKAVIKAKLKKILRSAILLVLYINLKFLYKYLYKLSIIQEKQLIVDLMNLRQLYK